MVIVESRRGFRRHLDIRMGPKAALAGDATHRAAVFGPRSGRERELRIGMSPGEFELEMKLEE